MIFFSFIFLKGKTISVFGRVQKKCNGGIKKIYDMESGLHFQEGEGGNIFRGRFHFFSLVRESKKIVWEVYFFVCDPKFFVFGRGPNDFFGGGDQKKKMVRVFFLV